MAAFEREKKGDETSVCSIYRPTLHDILWLKKLTKARSVRVCLLPLCARLLNNLKATEKERQRENCSIL